MSSKPDPRQIFNPALRRLRRERAARRTGEFFLLHRTADDAAERVADVNRQFKSALIIGLPAFRHRFLERLPVDKIPVDIQELDDWPDDFSAFKGLDLIVSGLVLQSWNDVPGALVGAKGALIPDGFFVASLIGGESLLSLKRACFAADQQKYGGIVPRVAPMIDIQQAAMLLGRAGFAQPVIDRDECKISYSRIETLAADLRDIGETNCLVTLNSKFEGRDFIKRLSGGFTGKSPDGKHKCVFEILWLTGWSPHESQQKPLKPGSAKTRLSDALKEIRG